MLLSKFVLGRGELKNSLTAFSRAFRVKAALLVLGIGFFFQTHVISAQEGTAPLTQDDASLQLPAEDPLRDAERALLWDDTTPAAAQLSGPSVWSVIRMILALALVAAAIYGIVLLFKKAGKQTPNEDPFLKILANTHLGSNRYAHIISVGAKAWLVGSSDGGVNLISEIEDKELIDAMLLEDANKIELPAGRFTSFMSILRRFGVKAQARTKIPGADDIRKRRERLKGL